MSGMGGLSGRIMIIFVDQGLKAMGQIIWENPLASVCFKQMRHTLLFGETLRAFHTKVGFERIQLAKNKTLGMVIVERIGQSACLLPKSVKSAYGRASETERVWVDDEGIDNLSRPKIQSIPLGKLRGIRVPTAIRHSCCCKLHSITIRNNNLIFFVSCHQCDII